MIFVILKLLPILTHASCPKLYLFLHKSTKYYYYCFFLNYHFFFAMRVLLFIVPVVIFIMAVTDIIFSSP